MRATWQKCSLTHWGGEDRGDPEVPQPLPLVGVRGAMAQIALQLDCESSPHDGWPPPRTPGAAGPLILPFTCLFLPLLTNSYCPRAGFPGLWPLLSIRTGRALALGPRSQTESRFLLNFTITQQCSYFLGGCCLGSNHTFQLL